MKYKPDKKQMTWAVTAFLTVAAILLFYFLVFHFGTILKGINKINSALTGIIWGIVIAMILTPLCNKIERAWFKPRYDRQGIDLYDPRNRKQKNHVRKFTMVITELIFLLIITALILLVVPETVRSIQEIANNFTMYLQHASKALDTWIADLSKSLTENKDSDTQLLIDDEQLRSIIHDITDRLQNFVTDTLLPNLDNIVSVISKSVQRIVRVAVNTLVAIIVSFYLLYNKETMAGQFKKLTYGIFKEKHANAIISECRFIFNTFVGFIGGKIVDSIIIGIMCFVGTFLLQIPYAGLVSIIVGATNIIPFFGPYIGAIMGAFLIVLIDPLKALIFLIFVICLQQFDGNVLGPKILANSTGLTSFWVMFAIMLFGGVFGVTGWIIGVPLFAVIYAGVRKLTNRKLRKINMPTNTNVYIDSDYFKDGRPVPLDHNRQGTYRGGTGGLFSRRSRKSGEGHSVTSKIVSEPPEGPQDASCVFNTDESGNASDVSKLSNNLETVEEDSKGTGSES